MKMRILVLFWMGACLQMGLLAQENVHEGVKQTGVPGKLDFIHPDGEKGWYQKGLAMGNDGVYDMRGMYGISFKIKADRNVPVKVRCTLEREALDGRRDMVERTVVEARVLGKGWVDVTLPLRSFDYNKGQDIFLKFIKRIGFGFEYEDGKRGNVSMKGLHLLQSDGIHVVSDVYSKPLDGNWEAFYEIKVQNQTDCLQSYALSMCRRGWEGFSASVSPCNLCLKPGEEARVTVHVKGDPSMPQGVHETQILQIVPLLHAGKVREVGFTTVVPVASPFLVHQEKGWQEVKEKIGKYGWAKKEFEKYVQAAEAFAVPDVKKGTVSDQGTEGLVRAYIEGPLFQTAVVWKLTGNRAYGEKVAETLRRISDPALGYPRTRHLTLQGIPQEGGTFEGMVRCYDLLKNSDLLSAEDRDRIEYTFRLFCNEMIDILLGDGGISNWTVFNIIPAAEAALLIHDLDLFDKLMYGPCGIVDQFRHGTMDDGWWYEVSLSYNIGAASCFTRLIPAASPFGIDLKNAKFRSSLTRTVGLRPFERENFLGMSFGKYGPLKSGTIDIKRLWDGILVYPDYRGVMFGMGDGHEQMVGGSAFECAYHVFRDPRYASIIRQAAHRDLIYGVPELPEDTFRLYSRSGYSDNAGIVVLRSQTEGREQREQIQAAVKYGTHGSYHGHFDKMSLLSLMRYGRSFWNPETSWYGYGSYMYKWWVQASMAHNMVVVDGKMQEPADSRNVLFHSGMMMQVVGVEADVRWSNPPYMGGYEQVDAVRSGDAPFVPIPNKHPEIGGVTGYTEPVRQCRVVVVTDDYVVLADYLKAGKEHVFDNLLHLKGVSQPERLKEIGRHECFDECPLSSGQFITNVKDFAVEEGAFVHSVMHAREGVDWNMGGFNGYQEPGDLNMDVYYAWPKESILRIGTYPDALPVGKKISYEVSAGGETLDCGVLGTWILGKGQVDVPVSGKRQIRLSVKVDGDRRANTLFWTDVHIVDKRGKKVRLSPDRVKYVNVLPVPVENKDYEGGEVVVSGKVYPSSLPSEPEDLTQPAVLDVDLSGLDAERFVAVVGGDFPVGKDHQVRKTLSYRTKGTEAHFLTVIEPYEDKKAVKTVRAVDEFSVEVELFDGRVQFVTITGMNGINEGKPAISIVEKKDGKVLREEKTGKQ